MKYIVTHPGSAHRDDLLACALLLAHYSASPAAIYRRDPTPEELADPEVFVVDVGGRHEPARGNFDHHQLPREAPPTCALTLVLQHMGLYETALDAWMWLKDTEELDSKGPFTWAKNHLTPVVDGTGRVVAQPEWGVVAGIASSPVEGWLLKLFSTCSVIRPHGTDRIYFLLAALGEYLSKQLTDFAERTRLLGYGAKPIHWVPIHWVQKTDGIRSVDIIDPNNVSVSLTARPEDILTYVDATYVPRDQNPTFALEAWCKKHAPQAAVTVTQDDRGDGLCLFRRNDDPRIDFSRCEGMPGVVFAHKGGFVCKLAAGVDPVPVLQKAYVGYGDEAALRG